MTKSAFQNLSASLHCCDADQPVGLGCSQTRVWRRQDMRARQGFERRSKAPTAYDPPLTDCHCDYGRPSVAALTSWTQ